MFKPKVFAMGFHWGADYGRPGKINHKAHKDAKVGNAILFVSLSLFGLNRSGLTPHI